MQFKRQLLNLISIGYKPIDFVKLPLIRIGFPLLFSRSHYRKKLKIIRGYNPEVAHIISLEFRNDRQIKIQKQIQSTEYRYLLHTAVHGKKVDRLSIANGVVSKQSLRYLSNGSLGAILSHCQLWRDLLESNHPTFLIFEDDAVIPDDLDIKVKKLISQIPTSYDILYLGSGLKRFSNARKIVSPLLYQPYFPRRGLYAYIISMEGIKKILDNIFPIKITCGGIDTVIGNLVRRKILVAYHSYPDICQVDRMSPSNIYNFQDKRKKLHKENLV